MAPKKDKANQPPEYMTVNGQRCRRVKDPATGKFVYRPVQEDGAPLERPADGQRGPRNDESEERKWLEKKEREVQETRLRESKQQNLQQRRQKEKVGLMEKASSHRREPKVPVPAALHRLREENEQALKIGMNVSKPNQYAVIKEALDIEEGRYQAKVKKAKERAYEKTRGKLKVTGEAGLHDLPSDEEGTDQALVPKQELHDIDDYRRDLPLKGQLWSADKPNPSAKAAKPENGNARPQSARLHNSKQRRTNGDISVSELDNALPGGGQGNRNRSVRRVPGRGDPSEAADSDGRRGGGRGGGRGRGRGGGKGRGGCGEGAINGHVAAASG